MTAERNSLKLGIFTIIVVATFVAVLLWISKGVGGRMQPIAMRFKPVPIMPPLSTGSAVYIGGQKVGRVIRSELVRAETEMQKAPEFIIQVDAEIRDDIVLRSDCAAFAEGPPLGGDGIIKIDLGKADAVYQGPFIEGSEPGGFAAILAAMQGELDAADPRSLLGQIKSQLDPDQTASLMAKLHRSLADVNTMTSSLAKELTPAEKATLLAKIHEIIDNVSETTGQLRREFDPSRPDVALTKLHAAMDAINNGLVVLSRILANGETPITNTLVNVENMSGNIRDETDPDRPESLMAHFKKTSDLLNASLADINTVTMTTRDVIVLNRENLNRMLLNFKESSDHIKTGLKYVLRNPWRLMNAPSPTEQQQQAIFDAARSFSEAASRIDDATAQLRALSELHDGNVSADDPDLARIRADLKKSAELYEKAEAEVWRQLGAK